MNAPEAPDERRFAVVDFTDNQDTTPGNARDLTWRELVSDLREAARVAPCTAATCEGRSCPHKNGPAWSPVRYSTLRRASKNVIAVSALVLDLDKLDHDAYQAALSKLTGLAFLAYGTHSDGTNGKRCARVVVPLTHDVPGVQWESTWRGLVARLGLDDVVDHACKEPARLHYLPCVRADAAYASFVEQVGALLDPSGVDLEAFAAPQALTSVDDSGHTFPPASPLLMAAARRWLKSHGPAISGQGGDTHTFVACAKIVRGFALSDAEATEVLSEWNASNVPPWSGGELRAKMDNAANYANGALGEGRARAEREEHIRATMGAASPTQRKPSVEAPGNQLPTDSDRKEADSAPDKPIHEPGTFGAEIALALDEVKLALGAGEDFAKVTPLFEPASDLMRRRYREDPWLVRNLVRCGGVLVLAGPPKTTKTWAMTEIAFAVANGIPAFGEFETGPARRVGYFFAEDLAHDVQAHLGALAASRGLDPDAATRNLIIQPRGATIDVLQVNHLALLVASVRRLGLVDLLILDPLRDVHSGEENDSGAMSSVFRHLRALGKVLGCTIGVLHHSSKPSQTAGKRNGGQRMRGSSAIHGSVDSGLYIVESGGDGETQFLSEIESQVKGARSGGHFKLKLDVVDGPDGRSQRATWTVERGAPSAADVKAQGVSDDATQLLGIIAGQLAKHESTDQRTLLKLLKGGKQGMTAALEKLLSDGSIARRRKGGYELTLKGRAQLAGTEPS